MAGVSYALADFVTGGPIVDLPVMAGATWATQLNRSDALTCTVDLRDAHAAALDLGSASEPDKTILVARNDADVVLAWGRIDEREWDEDGHTLTLTAVGIWDHYFGSTNIAPVDALTADLIVTDAEGFRVVNPILNTSLSGLSYGSIGKRLIEQRLAWPGAPTVFDLPPDEIGTRVRNYLFSDMKRTAAALDDLTKVGNGPDFAFDAQRASDGLTLRYVMRHGSEAQPRIGTDVGVWSLGPQTPITKFKKHDKSGLATASWMTAGRSAGSVLISRATNPELIASGYAPSDAVDQSHGDVKEQTTLDEHNAGRIADVASLDVDISFTVRADATPALGSYRPGDTVVVDVPKKHPTMPPGPMPIRITSVSGDEKGKTVDIGCVVLDG